MSDLHRTALLGAEMKHLQQLFRLAGPLGTEEREGGIGGHDGALFAREEVARVLGREDERTVVFADAARKADDEATDRRVLEQQPKLVDHEHAAPVLAFDARPQRLGEQEVDRRDHLVAELAHAEDRDRGVEVDVRGRAEHLPEAAVDPAIQDDADASVVWQTVCHIAKDRFVHLFERVAYGGLDHGALRLVEIAAQARAQIDGVGGGRAEPGLVLAIGTSQVEDVESVA